MAKAKAMKAMKRPAMKKTMGRAMSVAKRAPKNDGPKNDAPDAPKNDDARPRKCCLTWMKAALLQMRRFKTTEEEIKCVMIDYYTAGQFEKHCPCQSSA